MTKSIVVTTALCLIFAGMLQAGSNELLKVAVHILPQEDRSCSGGWPVITDCAEILNSHSGCEGFDAFPVFYDISEVRRIEFGLIWPGDWGTCTYTPCRGDVVTGDIASPGDGVIHEWNECHFGWSVVTGYARFGPPLYPGVVAPISNPVTGSLGTVDCRGRWDDPLGVAAAGLCGVPGEDPCKCGCPVEPGSWSAVKALFR